MATAAAYPTTAQDMLDRLLTDREFLIRTIVVDNFPAVKAKFDAVYPDRSQHSVDQQALTAYLLSLDRQFGEGAVVEFIDVPFRNQSTGFRVLSDAMAQARDMVAESGSAPAKNFLFQGIGALVGGVGNIINGRYIADGQERIQAAAIAAQAANDQAKAAQRTLLIKWGIIAGTIVLVLAILLVFRKQ